MLETTSKCNRALLVSATLALCSLGNWQTGATAPERCFTLLILAEMQLSAHVISYSCLKLLFNTYKDHRVLKEIKKNQLRK